jgi:site-specific recombinase XerC
VLRLAAGQRALDQTRGNLKAVQKLLGHASVSTTGDIYVDWDIDQLAQVLREILGEAERENVPRQGLAQSLHREG